MSINYYKKINNAYNTKSARDIDIYNVKKAINIQFEKNPSVFDVVINNNKRSVVITSSTKDKTKTIISKPDESLANGDIVKWRNKNWIITDCDPNDDIYSKGILLKCVSSLRWLDSSGEIVELPFALTNDNITNFGVDDGKIIELPNERRNIVISANEKTDVLNKKKRFIFDGRAWSITAINKLDTGLNFLTLKEDLINNATDNLELEIADYNGNIADYQLRVLNVKDVVAIEENQTLQLNIELTNNSKVIEIDNQITYSVTDETIISVSPTGLVTPLKKGISKITISFRNVSQTIQINVTSSTTNNYSAHISGDDFIKYNMTKSFACSFKDNGIDRKEKARFWLTETDGLTPTTLASIIEQDGQICKIKVNNKKGRVILHVENSTRLAYSTKEIEIKSLL
ncbi:Ig-like domain-containing protein [Paenibacillus polymyxa]|uniref:Ig-like domain-containing protein n=1 Tax=Paenibacillus polymyxa TaxID=1406 RepID=UPI002AB489F7|nr:Ig-like domain-containing protein [Paenibacillus polymyxa]MDY8021259.1 Ig-like domain-containing protein [Paenibacillus polymyxa]